MKHFLGKPVFIVLTALAMNVPFVVQSDEFATETLAVPEEIIESAQEVSNSINLPIALIKVDSTSKNGSNFQKRGLSRFCFLRR